MVPARARSATTGFILVDCEIGGLLGNRSSSAGRGDASVVIDDLEKSEEKPLFMDGWTSRDIDASMSLKRSNSDCARLVLGTVA